MKLRAELPLPKNQCTRVLVNLCIFIIAIVIGTLLTILYSIALLGAFALFYHRVLKFALHCIKRAYVRK